MGQESLTHPGLEKINEAYHSRAPGASIKLSLDYRFIDNPA